MPLITFRGATVNNPLDVSGIDQEIQCYHFLPVPMLLGDVSKRGDGTLLGRRRIRYKIEVECAPFSRQVIAGQTQNYGALFRLVEQIFTCPYIWIVNAYEGLSGTSTLKRADYNRIMTTPFSATDTFWNQAAESPAGKLPWLVVPDGDIEPDYAGGGMYNLNFTLMAADPES